MQVEVEGVEDTKALENAYREMTGFRLRTSAQKEDGTAPATTAEVEPDSGREKMEINAAYGLIRSRLDEHGLYKTSLKQGQIVLSFISPQVGERHLETIRQLAEETGYPISVHPHPNQQEILKIASQLAREAGWQVRKGPGIHVDRGAVSVTLGGEPDDSTEQRVAETLERQTGYTLEVQYEG